MTASSPPDLPAGTVVVMGVAGSGKTTVGRALAGALGRPFLDADDLHDAAARAKMARGEGLTDAERSPWIARVAAAVAAHRAAGTPAVVACSALRAAHRAALAAADPALRFLWLDAPPDVLRARLAERADHYAGADLLPSQLDTLEPPAPGEAVRLDARRGVAALVAEARRALRA